MLFFESRLYFNLEPHWVKNWVKTFSKSLEILENACKRRERVEAVLFNYIKGIRRISKRAQNAEHGF